MPAGTKSRDSSRLFLCPPLLASHALAGNIASLAMKVRKATTDGAIAAPAD
ncbi:hypothetical protein G4G28_07360 [Massilia sp. Dwa41.01b]|uniref:hypothetical protein n=1 Tax=Massilia sp. Se16.2.3 TaxID=2709303 RepID=UPI0015FF70F2|nr:hypothetical protein [Massilia sp. Se16.2.3]QNA88364.1 hypothetical protein G4G28_07360 [Massilia sp. Dwa41.01b]QNA99263.1 hypothetical protein G4G31_11055 [Massilia sp. Se16.2.3]